MKTENNIKIPILLIGSLFFLTVFPVRSFASDSKIINDGVFGISESTFDTTAVEYVFGKADSLHQLALNELRLSDIYSPPLELKEYYKFEYCPGLYLLFFIEGNTPYIIGTHGFHLSAIFNSIDSTVLFFDDDILKFNSLIKRYLSVIIENNLHEDLLNLYLNSLSSSCRFYLLLSASEYENIWIAEKLRIENLLSVESLPDDVDKEKLLNSLGFDDKHIEKDLKKAKKKIGGCKIEESLDTLYASFYSWNDCGGRLEFWRIKISPEEFSVLERKYVKKGMGPYQPSGID